MTRTGWGLMGLCFVAVFLLKPVLVLQLMLGIGCGAAVGLFFSGVLRRDDVDALWDSLLWLLIAAGLGVLFVMVSLGGRL